MKELTLVNEYYGGQDRGRISHFFAAATSPPARPTIASVFRSMRSRRVPRDSMARVIDAISTCNSRFHTSRYVVKPAKPCSTANLTSAPGVGVAAAFGPVFRVTGSVGAAGVSAMRGKRCQCGKRDTKGEPQPTVYTWDAVLTIMMHRNTPKVNEAFKFAHHTHAVPPPPPHTQAVLMRHTW